MASRGSVIPLFCDQIREGKSLTITNPNMTRFMMTLSDAVDLVLYAFAHGEQGDLFVQKAPAATIETLAQAVLELKGSDLGVTTIGTRHGEKLFEVLVTAEEMLRAEDLPGFLPHSGGQPESELRQLFQQGQSGTRKDRAVHLPQYAAAECGGNEAAASEAEAVRRDLLMHVLITGANGFVGKI